MRTKLAIGLFVACACAMPAISHSDSQEPGRGAREREVGTFRKVYRGEVVLRTNEATLVVALDEADERGRTDGHVDQVFALWAVESIIHPLSLRDPAGEIEIRADRARILLHSEQQEIELLMTGARPDPAPVYPLQAIRYAAEFVRYSGPSVEDYLVNDFESETPTILKTLQKPRPAFDLFEALTPPPAPSTGNGGCKTTCSVSCTTGSCAAGCQSGHCASCTCSPDTPPSAPVCYCN